jgi:hypothetical protein
LIREAKKMKNGKSVRIAGIIIITMIILLSSVTGVTIKNSQETISPEIFINESKSYPMAGKETSDDNTSPSVEILRPARALYFRDRLLLPRIIRLTQIIGRITVIVNATDNESGIDRVEFYCGPLGRKYLGNATSEPYNLTWRRDRLLPRVIHIHQLKVVAYDNAGNSASDRMFVRKIL